MKSTSIYTTLSFSSLLLLATAWPLVPDSLERRKPATYSVVPVDGGSAGGDGAAATTITDAVTHTETIMKTRLSTIVITESETPTTIVFTVTSPMMTQVATAPPESSAQPSQPTPPNNSPSIGYPAPSIPIEVPPPVTITVTQPLPSSRPYDDGMWHTHYYYTVSSESESSSTVSPTPAWAAWTLASSAVSPTTTAIVAVEFWGGPDAYGSTVSTSEYSIITPTGTLEFWGGPTGT